MVLNITKESKKGKALKYPLNLASEVTFNLTLVGSGRSKGKSAMGGQLHRR